MRTVHAKIETCHEGSRCVVAGDVNNMLAVGRAGQLGSLAETVAYIVEAVHVPKQLMALLDIRSSWLKPVILDSINCAKTRDIGKAS
jgi:hypothetical protein